jgi:hypothetical protein
VVLTKTGLIPRSPIQTENIGGITTSALGRLGNTDQSAEKIKENGFVGLGHGAGSVS